MQLHRPFAHKPEHMLALMSPGLALAPREALLWMVLPWSTGSAKGQRELPISHSKPIPPTTAYLPRPTPQHKLHT